MNISLEVIPSSFSYLEEQKKIVEKFKFNKINIPDILRFPIRSYEVENFDYYIPHIRSIDFNLKESKIDKVIEKHKEILILNGDIPSDPSFSIYKTSTLDMLAYLKEKDILSHIVFDQYRDSFRSEISYLEQKISFGGNDIFTQPFFDVKFVEFLFNYVDPSRLYIGISPVLSEKSLNYWKRVNNVVFPSDFNISFEKQIETSNEIISLCKHYNSNIYFMPIRTDLNKFFSSIEL